MGNFIFSAVFYCDVDLIFHLSQPWYLNRDFINSKKNVNNSHLVLRNRNQFERQSAIERNAEIKKILETEGFILASISFLC